MRSIGTFSAKCSDYRQMKALLRQSSVFLMRTTEQVIYGKGGIYNLN
jgi:hypothetical protein